MIRDVSQLRDRITIQKPQMTQGKYGQQEITWVDAVPDLPSFIRDLSGREFFESAAKMIENVLVITIRRRRDLTPDMRVLYKGALYDIIHLPEKGLVKQPGYMELRVKLRKGEGT